MSINYDSSKSCQASSRTCPRCTYLSLFKQRWRGVHYLYSHHSNRLMHLSDLNSQCCSVLLPITRTMVDEKRPELVKFSDSKYIGGPYNNCCSLNEVFTYPQYSGNIGHLDSHFLLPLVNSLTFSEKKFHGKLRKIQLWNCLKDGRT